MKAHAKKAFVIVCGTAAAVLIAATLSVTVSRPANATAGFAAQTSKPCGFCHQNPAGGGKLKPAGEKFKANGNKL
jgi:cytochrome c553